MIRLRYLLLSAFFLCSLCSAGEIEALQINNIACVPLRAIADWLGATLTVNNGVLTASFERTKLSLRIDHANATLNGKRLTLLRPVFLREGVTYLPIRSLADAFHLPLNVHSATSRLTLRHPRSSRTLSIPMILLNRDGSEMLWVPAGTFTMGTVVPRYLVATGESLLPGMGGDPAESPAHRVWLDGFWISRYETTVAQYRAFCQATRRGLPVGMTQALRDDLPISNVTWHDAQAYAQWAGGRLPTEAEWEKAARGSDSREFPWGDRQDIRVTSGERGSPNVPSPVGTASVDFSPFGLYDMAGNVREWCADWFDSAYYGVSPWSNPLGAASGSLRAVRGLTGQNHEKTPQASHCAARIGLAPADSALDLGFRLVLPASVTSNPARRSVILAPIMQPHLLYHHAFPEGYRCVGAWFADLNDDGAGEVVAVATGAPGMTLPPLLTVLQFVGHAPAGRIIASECMTIDGGEQPGLWRRILGEEQTETPLPLRGLMLRDLNADGLLDIVLIVQSAGGRDHDEALYVFDWLGTNRLRQLAQIPFPKASRGAWLIDEVTRANPGCEIITVGRCADASVSAAYPFQWFTFRYFAWNGIAYTEVRCRETSQKYLDAQQAIQSVDW